MEHLTFCTYTMDPCGTQFTFIDIYIYICHGKYRVSVLTHPKPMNNGECQRVLQSLSGFKYPRHLDHAATLNYASVLIDNINIDQLCFFLMNSNYSPAKLFLL